MSKGNDLKGKRERLGLSVDKMSSVTGIPVDRISEIEDGKANNVADVTLLMFYLDHVETKKNKK